MPDFGRTSTSSAFKHLVIRTLPDGYVFGKKTSIGFQPDTLKVFTPADFPETFEHYLRSNNWSRREDLQVILIEFTNRFMVLPNAFTKDGAVQAYFAFQNGESGEQQVYTAPLDDNKQTFCWEIQAFRDRHYERLFPNLTVLTSSYVLTTWTLQEAQKTQGDVLTAHFYGRHLHVFAARKRQLLFANSFEVKNHEEIAYFLLRTVEQLALDPHTLRVCLCCDSFPFSELYKLLSPYLAVLAEAEFTFHPEQLFRIKPLKTNAE
jgi:hypothetical protein